MRLNYRCDITGDHYTLILARTFSINLYLQNCLATIGAKHKRILGKIEVLPVPISRKSFWETSCNITLAHKTAGNREPKVQFYDNLHALA